MSCGLFQEETIEEAKDEVVGKAEEFEEKAEEVAENLRVPVPETRLPFFGKVQSLALKQVPPSGKSEVLWIILSHV